jgi:hypothetical protein
VFVSISFHLVVAERWGLGARLLWLESASTMAGGAGEGGCWLRCECGDLDRARVVFKISVPTVEFAKGSFGS